MDWQFAIQGNKCIIGIRNQTRVPTVHRLLVKYFVLQVFVKVFVDRTTVKAKHMYFVNNLDVPGQFELFL